MRESEEREREREKERETKSERERESVDEGELFALRTLYLTRDARLQLYINLGRVST